MSMPTPTMEQINARLVGLERQNHRLRWAAVGLSALAFVAFVEVRFGISTRPRVIEAEGLVIKDHQGRVRAKLGLEGNDPGLKLLDGRGMEQISLAVGGTDFSLLTFADKGQTRLLLESTGDGGAAFRMFDKTSTAMGEMFMTPRSATGLSLSTSQRGIAMGVDANGQSALFGTDAQGRENARVGSPAVTARSLGLLKGPMVTHQTTSPAGEVPTLYGGGGGGGGGGELPEMHPLSIKGEAPAYHDDTVGGGRGVSN